MICIYIYIYIYIYEAVWDPELVSERMPKVVEVLKALYCTMQ